MSRPKLYTRHYDESRSVRYRSSTTHTLIIITAIVKSVNTCCNTMTELVAVQLVCTTCVTYVAIVACGRIFMSLHNA